MRNHWRMAAGLAISGSGGLRGATRQLIPGALPILKGAVPDQTRGSGHTAPTYVVGSRDRTSDGQGGSLSVFYCSEPG